MHEFLVLDSIILKKHPLDVWKSDSKSFPKLVIGTTAHAAFDNSMTSPYSSNLTSEEIRKLVADSKVGQLNLTEEVFERYNDTIQGLWQMISDIRIVCPLLVIARSQPNLHFYVVTQTQGNLKLADVDSDIQGILGRYRSETPEKRRYFDAIRQLFYHYVSHGKIVNYNSQSSIITIDQDIIPQPDSPNCDFWIEKQFVPHYATVF